MKSCQWLREKDQIRLPNARIAIDFCMRPLIQLHLFLRLAHFLFIDSATLEINQIKRGPERQ